jgi:hypothetical protein
LSKPSPHLLVSVIFPAFLLLLSAALCRPMFQSNDDAIMSLLASGNCFMPYPDEHILFSSFIIGDLLKSLYTAVPQVTWYSFYEYLVNSISLFVTCWCLTRKNFSWISFLQIFIWFVLVTSHSINSIQFTTTSCLAGTAALALLIEWLFEFKKLEPKIIACIIVGFLISTLVRFEGAVLEIVLGFVFLGSCLIAKSCARSRLMGGAGILATCLAFSFGLNHLNDDYYIDSGWSEFRQVNRAVAQFADYERSTDDISTKNLLSKIGWTDNDIALVRSYFFLDKEVFSLQKMHSFLVSVPPVNTNSASFLRSLQSIMNDALIEAILFVLVMAAIFLDYRRFSMLQFVVLILGVLALNFLLFAFGRLDPHVSYPTYCFALYIALRFIDKSKLKRLLTNRTEHRRWATLALTAVLIFCAIWFTNDQYRKPSRLFWRRSEQLKQAISESLTPEYLYITWPNFPYELLPPYENPKVFFDSLHFLPLGGQCQSPTVDGILRKINAHNAADLFRDERVRFISGNKVFADRIILFAKQHYSMPVRLAPISLPNPASDLTVYKFKQESDFAKGSDHQLKLHGGL